MTERSPRGHGDTEAGRRERRSAAGRWLPLAGVERSWIARTQARRKFTRGCVRAIHDLSPRIARADRCLSLIESHFLKSSSEWLLLLTIRTTPCVSGLISVGHFCSLHKIAHDLSISLPPV